MGVESIDSKVIEPPKSGMHELVQSALQLSLPTDSSAVSISLSFPLYVSHCTLSVGLFTAHTPFCIGEGDNNHGPR